MIEKSNYDSPDIAYKKINSIYESIQSKEDISFIANTATFSGPT